MPCHARTLLHCMSVSQAAHSLTPPLLPPDLIYAVPNDASTDILNEEDVHGNIALIDRGKVPTAVCNRAACFGCSYKSTVHQVPLVVKVQRAQAAGAIGVVIVDNGGCNDEYECGVLGERSSGRSVLC